MRRLLLLSVVLAGCPSDDKPSDDTDTTGDTDVTADSDTGAPDTDTDAAGPRVTVRTVDAAGDPLPVQRVAWHDVAVFAVPLRPVLTELACAEGAPPCATWVLDAPDLPARIHVLAELEQPDRTFPVGDTDTSCFYWSSQHTLVQLPDGADPQLVHIVLDPEQGWCETLLTAGPVPPIPTPTVHPDDVRVPPPSPTGTPALLARDAEGVPVPLTTAVWYYPPEGPAYDGEHPLDCADALCTSWSLPAGAAPTGAFHVAATYAGPYHPIQGAAFTDFQAALLDGVDELPVTLTFDTTAAQIQ